MGSMTMSDMSMTMSMDMATSTGMSMPMSTSMSMSDSSTMMGMSDMSMTFFTSTTTTLYSSTWTPKSTGQYAGTCIFLIIFAILFRALLAFRINFFLILRTMRERRTKGIIHGYATENLSTIRPWRANEAVWLACLDVLAAGFGYLLMIAVMTMNVGYFLSVLAGVFAGSLLCGRFTANSAAH